MPDIASLYVFPLFLVFCRLGAALMVFPAISDPSVNTRTRLLIAFVGSVMLWPVVSVNLPDLPSTTLQLLMYVGVELVVGIMMALAARMFMAAINVAGEMIAFATGFQAATLFDPVTSSNTTAPTVFLMLIAGVLIFATNLHHVLLDGIVQSYTVFPPGALPPVGDSVQAVINTMQNLFVVGLKMASPVVVIGFLTYVAFGIFNRLIPQLHVFFVALPVSIAVGLFVTAAALSSMFALFMTQLHNHAIIFNQ